MSINRRKFILFSAAISAAGLSTSILAGAFDGAVKSQSVSINRAGYVKDVIAILKNKFPHLDIQQKTVSGFIEGVLTADPNTPMKKK